MFLRNWRRKDADAAIPTPPVCCVSCDHQKEMPGVEVRILFVLAVVLCVSCIARMSYFCIRDQHFFHLALRRIGRLAMSAWVFHEQSWMSPMKGVPWSVSAAKVLPAVPSVHVAGGSLVPVR